MMRVRLLLALPLSLSLTSAAQAAELHPVASAGSLLQVLLGLIAVLVLMAATAWILRRLGVSGATGGNVAKIIGGVSVGNRERVVVVEVADQWIVVGVAQGRVNALSTMPRQPQAAAPQALAATGFAGWLKQTIDKRNGNS